MHPKWIRCREGRLRTKTFLVFFYHFCSFLLVVSCPELHSEMGSRLLNKTEIKQYLTFCPSHLLRVEITLLSKFNLAGIVAKVVFKESISSIYVNIYVNI